MTSFYPQNSGHQVRYRGLKEGRGQSKCPLVTGLKQASLAPGENETANG